MAFERITDDSPSMPERVGPKKSALKDMLASALANTGAVPVKKDDRRFTDKADLDPAAVRSLPINHPAMVGNRTLFPSTVVDVGDDFEDRLLVSGKNNRKLGERILKGKFKGYALYGLSLEERATCPTDCSVRGYCYGNGMQMARRHRITDLDLFSTFLEDEIRTILADPIDGLMVRLHVLGDFPSVEYVALWADLLEMHPKLACYGYTHRRDEIGDAIESLKSRYPTRFRIRWSGDVPMTSDPDWKERTCEAMRNGKRSRFKRAVLAFIASDPNIDAEQVASRVGLTVQQVKIIWRRAVRMGEVERRPRDGRRRRQSDELVRNRVAKSRVTKQARYAEGAGA